MAAYAQFRWEDRVQEILLGFTGGVFVGIDEKQLEREIQEKIDASRDVVDLIIGEISRD